MAVVPVTMNVIISPKNKTVAPYNATITGYAWLSDKQVGGGPAPGGPPPEIWGDVTYPDNSLPEPPTPDQPPLDVVKPFPPAGGWGYSDRTGWVFKPGSGTAGPKK